MKKKYFKLSYQTIKDILTFVLFITIASYFIGKYRHLFIISEEEFLKSSGLEITLIILIIFGLIWFVYSIFDAIIGGLYKVFVKREYKWYETLTHNKIKIPITMKQYESMKNNKMFFTKYPHDSHPIFSYDEMEKWSERIIEKELNKIKGENKK